MDRLSVVIVLLAACSDKPELVVERVQAIDTRQATSLAVEQPATKPASAPTHAEKSERKLCDRTFAQGPKVAGPGKPTWINLWAAWCKPCVAEIPELRQWAEAGGFELVLVSLDDDEREWRAGVEKLGLPKGKEGNVTSKWLAPGKARGQFLKPLGFLDTPTLPGQGIADKAGHLRCFRSGAVETEEKDAFLSYVSRL